MKSAKKLSFIFKQGGSVGKMGTFSSNAFVPANLVYGNYQLGGLAALPFGNRAMPYYNAQNGVLAAAINPPAYDQLSAQLMQAADAAAAGNNNPYGFDPTTGRGMQIGTPIANIPPQATVAPPVAAPVAAPVAPTAPVNPLAPVAMTPENPYGFNPITGRGAQIGTPIAGTQPDFSTGVTPEGFIQVAQKEGETRWQYRYDPANDIWQALDTRRPEKGWMVPDITSAAGKKADEAIRSRYQEDAKGIYDQVVSAATGAAPGAPASPGAQGAGGTTPGAPTAPGAGGTIQVAGQQVALPSASQPSATPSSATYEDLSRQFMGKYAEPIPAPSRWSGVPYEMPEQSSISQAKPVAPAPGTFVDKNNVVFSPMDPEEAAAIRAQRGPVEPAPLNLRPKQLPSGLYSIDRNPASDIKPTVVPTEKKVKDFTIKSDNSGVVTVTNKKGETFDVPEELGIFAEDLAIMNSQELEDFIDNFKSIISDKEQANYFNVKNRQTSPRPGEVRDKRVANQVTRYRENGGYSNNYFGNIARTFAEGGDVNSLQSGGMTPAMGAMLSNPSAANMALNVMNSNQRNNTSSSFTPSTTTIPTNRDFMFQDGGMSYYPSQMQMVSVEKTDPIKDFIQSPYKISSPMYDNYGKGDSYPGVKVTKTVMDTMYGFGGGKFRK